MAACVPIALGSGVRSRYMYNFVVIVHVCWQCPRSLDTLHSDQCTLHSRCSGTHPPHILHLGLHPLQSATQWVGTGLIKEARVTCTDNGHCAGGSMKGPHGFGCSGFIGLGGSFLCIPHGLLVRLGGNYRHPFGVPRVRSLVRRVVSFAFLSQIGLKERSLTFAL